MKIVERIKSRFSKTSRGRASLVEYNRNRSYWTGNSIYLDNIYNKIANDVAMMEFKHIKKSDDTWTIYTNSDLMEVLKTEPNADDTPVYFWADVIRTVLKTGVALVVPIYMRGTLKGLELADQVSTKENGKYAVVIDGMEIEVDKYNVWIFKNPKKNLTVQLNRIASLIDNNLQALSRKLNENENSNLKGLLKMKFKIMDDMMASRAERVLEQVRKVAATGGIGYLDEETEFQELKNSISTADPEELEFLKSQLYQAHGLNEKLFTCDYSEAQYRAYFNSVIKVYQRVIYEEINRKHFTKTARTQGQELKIFHDILNIASLKDFTEFASKGTFNAIVNANEAREAVGYPPYEGGDIFRTNLNSQDINDLAEGGEDDERKNDENKDNQRRQ